MLVASDHAVFRQRLCALLQAESDFCVVGRAENGRQVVDMTKRLQPDVVVMDLAMPLIDGLDAIRQIHAQHLKSKVLILSYDAGVKQSFDREVITAIREAKVGHPFFSPSINNAAQRNSAQSASATNPMILATDGP